MENRVAKAVFVERSSKETLHSRIKCEFFIKKFLSLYDKNRFHYIQTLLFGKLLSSVRVLHPQEWNFQALQREAPCLHHICWSQNVIFVVTIILFARTWRI